MSVFFIKRFYSFNPLSLIDRSWEIILLASHITVQSLRSNLTLDTQLHSRGEVKVVTTKITKSKRERPIGPYVALTSVLTFLWLFTKVTMSIQNLNGIESETELQYTKSQGRSLSTWWGYPIISLKSFHKCLHTRPESLTYSLSLRGSLIIVPLRQCTDPTSLLPFLVLIWCRRRREYTVSPTDRLEH